MMLLRALEESKAENEEGDSNKAGSNTDNTDSQNAPDSDSSTANTDPSSANSTDNATNSTKPANQDKTESSDSSGNVEVFMNNVVLSDREPRNFYVSLFGLQET